MDDMVDTDDAPPLGSGFIKHADKTSTDGVHAATQPRAPPTPPTPPTPATRLDRTDAAHNDIDNGPITVHVVIRDSVADGGQQQGHTLIVQRTDTHVKGAGKIKGVCGVISRFRQPTYAHTPTGRACRQADTQTKPKRPSLMHHCTALGAVRVTCDV